MGTKELIKRLNDIKESRIHDEIIKALEEFEILRQEKKKSVEANWNKKRDEVYTWSPKTIMSTSGGKNEIYQRRNKPV